MPLRKFVLLIFAVLAAAGLTIWVGAMTLPGLQSAPASGVAITSLVLLLAYVAWRMFAERINSKENNQHDRIKK